MIRFGHQDIIGEMLWDENCHLNEIVIENPKFLRKIISDLALQSFENGLSLTEDGKPLKFVSEIDIIFNPLKLDFNNRRALTTLFKLLVKSSVSEEKYMETNQFKTEILKYFASLVDSENFNFEVEPGVFEIDSLAKAINLHIVGDEDNFVELICDYMSMMAELVGTKLFVFVNLRQFLEKKEIAQLIGNMKNHQLQALLIESCDYGKITGVERLVVDKDLCEI